MVNNKQILKDNIAQNNQSFFYFLTGNWFGRFEVHHSGIFNMALFLEYVNAVAQISFEEKQEFLEGFVNLHHLLLNAIIEKDQAHNKVFIECSLITHITEIHYSLLKSFFKNDQETQKSVLEDIANLIKYYNDSCEVRFTIIPLFEKFLDGKILVKDFIKAINDLSSKYNRVEYWFACGTIKNIKEEIQSSLIDGKIDNTLLIDIISQNLNECKKILVN